MTREQDPQDATRLGREAAGRMRLPGPPVGRALPSRIGSLASSVERFTSSLSRPVEVRRALRGPGSHEESVRPPRWWTGETPAGAEPAAPVARPAWLAGAAARRADVTLPERNLPRAARAVPNDESYTPGGILGGLQGQVARVRRLEEVTAAGPMLTSADTSRLGAATVRRRAIEAARRPLPPAPTPAPPVVEVRGAPAKPVVEVQEAPATSLETPGPAPRAASAPSPTPPPVSATTPSPTPSPMPSTGDERPAVEVRGAPATSLETPGPGGSEARSARTSTTDGAADSATPPFAVDPGDPAESASESPSIRRASFQLRPVASRLAAARARRDGAELSVGASDAAGSGRGVTLAERPGAHRWSEARHHQAAGLRGEDRVLRRSVGAAESVRTATATLLADQQPGAGPSAARPTRRASWAETSAVVRRRALEREQEQAASSADAVEMRALRASNPQGSEASRLAGSPLSASESAPRTSTTATNPSVPATLAKAGDATAPSPTRSAGDERTAPEEALRKQPAGRSAIEAGALRGATPAATVSAGRRPGGSRGEETATLRRTSSGALSLSAQRSLTPALGLAMPDLLSLSPRRGRAADSGSGLPSSFGDSEQIRPATGNLAGALPGASPRTVDAHGNAATLRRRATAAPTRTSPGLTLRTPTLTQPVLLPASEPQGPEVSRLVTSRLAGSRLDTGAGAPRTSTSEGAPEVSRFVTSRLAGSRLDTGAGAPRTSTTGPAVIHRLAADATAAPATPLTPTSSDAAALRAFLHGTARATTPAASGSDVAAVARRTPASTVSLGRSPGGAPEPTDPIRRSAAAPDPRREDPLTHSIPEGRPRPPALPIGPSAGPNSPGPNSPGPNGSGESADVTIRRSSWTRGSRPATPGGSLVAQTAHLFEAKAAEAAATRSRGAAAPGTAGAAVAAPGAPADGALTAPPSGARPGGPAVPASASLDPQQLDSVIAAVVQRIEQRVIDELERRGRRNGRGGF